MESIFNESVEATFSLSDIPLDLVPDLGILRATCYGPIDTEDTTQGVFARRWGGYLTSEGKFFAARELSEGVWDEFEERFTLIWPVTSIDMCFDSRGRLVVGFIREDKDLGVWSRPEGGVYSLDILRPTPSTLSILSMDTAQVVEDGDVVIKSFMFYGMDNNLYYRSEDDNFTTEISMLPTPNYQRPWVAKSGTDLLGKFTVKVKA